MPSQGRLGDKSQAQVDAHGCPACPHNVTGPAIIGSPDVLVNHRPALRMGDSGIHAACCGPNIWVAAQGSATVLINFRPAHRLGDLDIHCGGPGRLIEGSPDVMVGDQSAVAGMSAAAAAVTAAAGAAGAAPASAEEAGAAEPAAASAATEVAAEPAEAARAPSADTRGRRRFEFRIVDENCRAIRLRRPTRYRVCDQSGAVLEAGTLTGEAAVVFEGEPGRRYALWLDGEFVTFHDEPAS